VGRRRGIFQLQPIFIQKYHKDTENIILKSPLLLLP
jgi:hypothetical protein